MTQRKKQQLQLFQSVVLWLSAYESKAVQLSLTLCYCTFVSLLLLNCLTLNLTPSPAVMKPGLLVGCHVMSVGLIDIVWLCNLIKLSCGSKSVTFKYSSVFPWFKVSESLTVCSFLVWPTVEMCPTSAFDGLRNNHFIALFMSTMIVCQRWEFRYFYEPFCGDSNWFSMQCTDNNPDIYLQKKACLHMSYCLCFIDLKWLRLCLEKSWTFVIHTHSLFSSNILKPP